MYFKKEDLIEQENRMMSKFIEVRLKSKEVYIGTVHRFRHQKKRTIFMQQYLIMRYRER